MRRFIYLLCTLALMVLPSACIDEQTPPRSEVKIGDKLPDFTVTMNDGTTVTGALLREGCSVVVFFNSGCPDCRKALPSLQRLYEQYASQGVRFALISREESTSTIEPYWQSSGYTMPYSAQDDRSVYELFATSRVPRVYISDANGRVRDIFTDDPVPTYEELLAALLDII